MQTEIILNASVLAGIIKTLKPFMSTEESRFYLCGIHFEMKMDTCSELKAVATDGHKLCVLDIDVAVDAMERDLAAIIPARALATIQQMLKGLEAECPIQLRFSETHLFVDALDEKGEFRLVDGEFPNWRGVVPTTDPRFVIGLGKPQAKAALEAVKGHYGREGMEWRMTDAGSPIVMASDKKTVVVMPMRVSLPGEMAVDTEGGDEDNESDAALYERAKALVIGSQKASTSYCQRELKIGYNRAARMIERLEGEGIVGPANHVGKREVLIQAPSEEN